jgi:hypothetical protein
MALNKTRFPRTLYQRRMIQFLNIWGEFELFVGFEVGFFSFLVVIRPFLHTSFNNHRLSVALKNLIMFRLFIIGIAPTIFLNMFTERGNFF